MTTTVEIRVTAWYRLDEWAHRALMAVFRAFLCEKKNGGYAKTFSAKKFWAFFFCCLVAINYVWLFWLPDSHWTVRLTEKGVSDLVITGLISALNLLAGGALAVYGWSKAKGAA